MKSMILDCTKVDWLRWLLIESKQNNPKLEGSRFVFYLPRVDKKGGDKKIPQDGGGSVSGGEEKEFHPLGEIPHRCSVHP